MKSVNVCTVQLNAHSEKKYTGAQGEIAPEMPKRAPENQKRAPLNLHRVQCKTNFRMLFSCRQG